MWHLYEVVISNSWVWLKVQASCESTEQAGAFFEARFNGTDYITADGHRPVTPFRLAERSHEVANWASILDRLPTGWDDDEFQIVESPYPWCETLSDGCDCHGAKGRLDEAFCSDFGMHDETDRRASKSQKVRHRHHIQSMEERIARSDESRRQERLEREQRSPPRGAAAVTEKPAERGGDLRGAANLLGEAINGVNGLVARGFYCSIHGRHHPYGEQAIRKTVANLTAACVQMSAWAGERREFATSAIGQLAGHWLQVHQSEECAQRSVWGNAEIPDILLQVHSKGTHRKGGTGQPAGDSAFGFERRYGM